MSPAIPRATADTVEETLEGYYRASSDSQEQVTKEEVANEADVSQDVANRQKSFLVSLGLLEKDGYDYLTTEEGREVGKLLEFEKHDRAYAELKNVLLNWEPTTKLLEELGDDSVSEDTLFDELEFVTETKDADDDQRKTAGINGLIQWYERTNILERDSQGNWRAKKEIETSSSPIGDSKAENSEPVESETPKKEPKAETAFEPAFHQSQSESDSTESPSSQIKTGANVGVNLNINLDLSDDSDPEQVEQILSAIRKGLGEEPDENRSDDDPATSVMDLTDFDE